MLTVEHEAAAAQGHWSQSCLPVLLWINLVDKSREESLRESND